MSNKKLQQNADLLKQLNVEIIEGNPSSVIPKVVRLRYKNLVVDLSVVNVNYTFSDSDPADLKLGNLIIAQTSELLSMIGLNDNSIANRIKSKDIHLFVGKSSSDKL